MNDKHDDPSNGTAPAISKKPADAAAPEAFCCECGRRLEDSRCANPPCPFFGEEPDPSKL